MIAGPGLSWYLKAVNLSALDTKYFNVFWSSNYYLLSMFAPTDNIPPTFNFCNTTAIFQSTDANLPTATVTWSEPTATDNSGQVTVSSNYGPGDSLPVGNTTVQYVATDSAGNNDTCSFEVIITGKMRVSRPSKSHC